MNGFIYLLHIKVCPAGYGVHGSQCVNGYQVFVLSKTVHIIHHIQLIVKIFIFHDNIGTGIGSMLLDINLPGSGRDIFFKS